MANGINGGLCMVYLGTFAAKTEIVGQGDATSLTETSTARCSR